MRAILLALLLNPALAWSAPPRVVGQATVGAGADDNLNGATDPEERAGSVYGRAGASLGLNLGPTDLALGLAGHYTGTAYAVYPGLSSHAVGVSAGLYAWPSSSVLVTVVPRVGARWYGDDARDALDVGGSTSVKVRLVPALALRAGYGFTAAFASDPVFDRTAHDGSGGVELRPFERTWLSADYTLGVGQTVRYEPATAAVMVAGPGAAQGADGQDGERRNDNDTFGDDQVAVRVPATSHTVSLTVEQDLGDHVGLRASAGWSRVLADPEPYSARFGSLSVSVRY